MAAVVAGVSAGGGQQPPPHQPQVQSEVGFGGGVDEEAVYDGALYLGGSR